MPHVWSRAEFLALGPDERRRVQLDLADHALAVWTRFARDGMPTYRDCVVGDVHEVETGLPADALDCVHRERDDRDVHHRYLEPITALQDDDLRLPGDVRIAYHAIYNLYRRHLGHSPHPVDELDWLIVEQAGVPRDSP